VRRRIPHAAVATVVIALLAAAAADVVGEIAGIVFVAALTMAVVSRGRPAVKVGVLVLASPAAAVDLRLWEALPSQTTVAAVAAAHVALMLAIASVGRNVDGRAHDPRVVMALSFVAMLAAVSPTGAAGVFTWPLVCAWTVAAVLQLAAVSSAGGRRSAMAIALVALVFAPLLARWIPDRDMSSQASVGGGSNDAGLAPTYGGFTDRLDTGDRFERSETPVMRVRASEADFWRGQSFDVWDGRTWTVSLEDAEPVPQSGDTAMVRARRGEGDGGDALQQTFTLLRPGIDTVFGASRIASVSVPVGSVIQHGDGSLQWTEPMSEGTVYTVESDRYPVTVAELRFNDPRNLTPSGDSFVERFTLLPDVPDRVVEFAAQATAGASTTWDAVIALEAAIADQTEYTLDVPPLPDGADAVEQFLFVDRAGFCEQIATALAVMLRTQGIPARVATGFTPGERDPIGGDFLVRQSDAHAWVEVWFPSIGWHPFDPTAEVPLAGEDDTNITDFVIAVITWMLPVLIVLAVVAAIVLTRRRRVLSGRPWVVDALDRLDRSAQDLAVGRAPHETVDAHAARAAAVDDRLAAVALLVSREAYGSGLSDAERAEADRLLAALAGDGRRRRWRERLRPHRNRTRSAE
jgi:protein-glutamine gamma-glutamyltransferase